MADFVTPDDAYERLGNEPTATFGVVTTEILDNTEEIVGPLRPRTTYYGHVWTPGRVKPLVFLNFNKYRSDLPPWDNVTEFVLAAEDDGEVAEYTFNGLVEPQGINITGDLKTVSLACEYVWTGVERCDTIDRQQVAREAVAEKRGITTGNVRDGSEFRVDGVLD